MLSSYMIGYTVSSYIVGAMYYIIIYCWWNILYHNLLVVGYINIILYCWRHVQYQHILVVQAVTRLRYCIVLRYVLCFGNYSLCSKLYV